MRESSSATQPPHSQQIPPPHQRGAPPPTPLLPVRAPRPSLHQRPRSSPTLRPTSSSSTSAALTSSSSLSCSPQMSPTPRAAGRRLQSKLLEELKHVSRKRPTAFPSPFASRATASASPAPSSGGVIPPTPAPSPALPPTQRHAEGPPPLNLHTLSMASAALSSPNAGKAATASATTSASNSSPGASSASATEEPLPEPRAVHSASDPEDANANANGVTVPTGRAKACSICDRSFTVFRAKHTCKQCQRKICDDCSKNRFKLNRHRLERRKGSRFCDPCARAFIQTRDASTTNANTDANAEAIANTNASGNATEEASAQASTPTQAANTNNTNTATANAKTDTSTSGTHASSRQRPMSLPVSLWGSHITAAWTSSSASSLASASSSSHLRPRHWVSAALLASLLLARIFCVRHATPSHRGDASLLLQLMLVVAGWMDRLLTLRILASSVVGLVVYDEVSAWQHCQQLEHHQYQHHQHQLSRASSSTGTTTARRHHRLRSESGSSASLRSGNGAVRKRLRSRSRASLASSTSLHRRPREADAQEELQVEVGHEVADSREDGDRDGFQMDQLEALLERCTSGSHRVPRPEGDGKAEGTDMSVSDFLACCESICQFILVFGRATAFAASTVTGYITTIDANIASWPPPPSSSSSSSSWKQQSVRAVLQREVARNEATTGGKKKPSCARCVLRLYWFIEFVEACVRYALLENRDENCSAGASKAYEETIGSRHPWLVRKGVNSALAALPPRSGILAALHLDDLAADEAVRRLRHMQTQTRVVLDETKALLTELKLTDVK